MADIQPRVIVRPLDKDESGMAIDDGVSGTAHIEERSFPGLAATYPPPPVAQDAVLDVTNMGTADGVSPWSNIRRHVPAVPLSSRTKS